MNNRFFALILLIALGCIFSACEEIADPDGLPYVERLVVQATVSPNEALDSIFIRRTLPLTGRYDSVKAMLSDVIGSVEVDGQSYPLVYMGESRYAAEGLVGESGKTYKLSAEWHGKKVTATTTIPFPAVIESVTARRVDWQGQPQYNNYDSIGAIVQPRGNEVYGLEIYARYGSSYNYHSIINLNYEEVVRRASQTESDGKVHLIYDGYPRDLDLKNTRLTVYSFDAPFYDFYFSFYSSRDGDDFFFGGGQPVYWNIQGDGIGIFIGKTWVYKMLQ